MRSCFYSFGPGIVSLERRRGGALEGISAQRIMKTKKRISRVPCEISISLENNDNYDNISNLMRFKTNDYVIGLTSL